MAGGAVIVAGFGFRSGATPDSLRDALIRAGGGPGGAQGVAAIATASDKAEVAAFRDLAAALDLPVIGIDAALLARQPTRTVSAASLAARGTGSLAEAAALVAAGPGARLLGVRAVSGDGMATCAIAVGAAP